MKNLNRLFLGWLAMVLMATVGTAQATNSLFIKGNQFVDSNGATITLRGWNLSAKIPPYDTKATRASFEQLESWGTNVIRLSFIWEAMESQRGVYDESYLKRMDQIIRYAEERNIWVVIDIHQDSFSRYSLGGCGEGFPQWAISGTKYEPDNGESCKDWGTRMFNDFIEDGPMQLEWQSFYANTMGVRDSYLNMISMLTQRYKDEATVIGMDLLNEPFGLIEQIYELYEDAAKRIHSINSKWIIFTSPHAMTSGSISAVSFGNRPNIDNLVLSPHYYDPAIMQFYRYQGPGRYIGEEGSAGFLGTLAGWFFPSLRSAMTSLSSQVSDGGINIRSPEQAVADLKQIANEWQAPLFIGEFGVHATAIDTENFLDRFYAAMNKHETSGTQWVYAPQWTSDNKDGWNHEDLSSVDDQGNPRRGYRPHPYVVQLAGESLETTSFFEKPDSTAEKGIKLTYNHNPAKGSTRIYVPELRSDDYESQFHVELSSGSYTIDKRKKHVVISSAKPDVITATIKYQPQILQQRCRIFFEHSGFPCSDGISIRFSMAGYSDDREIIRYADYPQNQPYDFGEWPLDQEIEISTKRNWRDNFITKSFKVEPNLCGKIVKIESKANCFNAHWDLKLP